MKENVWSNPVQSPNRGTHLRSILFPSFTVLVSLPYTAVTLVNIHIASVDISKRGDREVKCTCYINTDQQANSSILVPVKYQPLTFRVNTGMYMYILYIV